MPLWGLSPELTGDDRRLAVSLPCCFPWWRVAVGGRSGRIPFNKPGFWPDQDRISLLFASSSCCHGGRRRGTEELRSFLCPYLVALQLFLLWELMQVMKLAQASENDLTVRVDRGVAPADADLFRGQRQFHLADLSRRQRQDDLGR
jgi:hypothetical protein